MSQVLCSEVERRLIEEAKARSGGGEPVLAHLLFRAADRIAEMRALLENIQVAYAIMDHKPDGFGELIRPIHAALAHLELP